MLHALRQTSILLFGALQVLCIILIYNSQTHHQKVLNFIGLSSSSAIHSIANNVEERFSTDDSEIEALSKANAALRKQLAYSVYTDCAEFKNRQIQLNSDFYTYTPATVISNSNTDQENYIIIDRGATHGVKAGSGVISDQGIVGIVLTTTSRFSKIMSISHVNMKISAALARTNHHGTITWEGQKGNTNLKFDFIPSQVPVNIQDTVVTSGYSFVFPKGIIVGRVSALQKKTNNSHDIDVKMATDLNSLSTVYVVNNTQLSELDSLSQR